MVAQVKAQQTVQVPVEVEIPANMTAAWFDAAVARSFEKDIAVKPLGQGRYAMRSSRDAPLVYIVTATKCQCEGFTRFHRCYHQCRAAFEDAFTGPEPSAPATIPAASIGPGGRCPGCSGDGQQRVHEEDGAVTIETCLICRGTGWITAPGPRQLAEVIGIPTMRSAVHSTSDHRTYIEAALRPGRSSSVPLWASLNSPMTPTLGSAK